MADIRFDDRVAVITGAGVFGNLGQANYAAAQMGLVGLSSVTAIEGARYNIKFNVITPRPDYAEG